jgi:hypothetical protein
MRRSLRRITTLVWAVRSCRAPGWGMTGSSAAHSPRSSAGTPSKLAPISRPTTSLRRSHTPNEDFSVKQTAGLGSTRAVGGNSWASLLLGIPSSGGYRNIFEDVWGGWIDGIYVQDQFKATPKLTLNLGFRNDMVWTPIYGTGKGGNYYTGNANPITGQYSSTRFRRTARQPRERPAFRRASTPHRARQVRDSFPRTPT